MEFSTKEIGRYPLLHTQPESYLLRHVSRKMHAKTLRLRMLSSYAQGHLLALLTRMIQTRHILEIGSYTGYSALCLCQNLTHNGLLLTIDRNKELEGFIRNVFAQSEYASRVALRIDRAISIIPQFTDTCDMVFTDADKINYFAYYCLTTQKVRPGGLIMADNALRSGKAVGQVPQKPDRENSTLLDFSKKVGDDPRVKPNLLSVRDGLVIAQVDQLLHTH
ncbi:O-methyltransferase [Persicitalea sp.]|uniref:O-methyltransferase n=1 Tax=Persicitalea sp. TaxID=3100273 RepID=UPI003592FEE4